MGWLGPPSLARITWRASDLVARAPRRFVGAVLHVCRACTRADVAPAGGEVRGAGDRGGPRPGGARIRADARAWLARHRDGRGGYGRRGAHWARRPRVARGQGRRPRE